MNVRKMWNSQYIKSVCSLISQLNYATDSITCETKPYHLHKLDKGPPSSAELTKKDALRYFKEMFIIRKLEVESSNLYKAKIIRGFCHLYTGQEAVAVGMKAAMRPQDTVVTAYRSHGWAYVMDVSILGVLAELAGRESGCSRGKGGSMHMYSPSFYGGNGIVGAQVPLGIGIAYSHVYKETKGISFTLYGDGAANQGQVFESFNIAKLWNLPVIFVCENNGYGLGTRSDRSSASTDYYSRGDYIPGILVDGMDVITVREATKFAIDHITAGNGPIVLEMVTYRYFGHSMSDPGTSYRTRDEVQEVRAAKDPISSFKADITSKKMVTEDELKKIEKDERVNVEEASKKATADKEVPLDELTADIYAKTIEKNVRGVTYYQSMPHKNVVTPANLK